MRLIECWTWVSSLKSAKSSNKSDRTDKRLCGRPLGRKKWWNWLPISCPTTSPLTLALCNYPLITTFCKLSTFARNTRKNSSRFFSGQFGFENWKVWVVGWTSYCRKYQTTQNRVRKSLFSSRLRKKSKWSRETLNGTAGLLCACTEIKANRNATTFWGISGVESRLF